VQVFVRDNDVEQALRVLKKRMQREGVFREMRRRRFYEKPSDRITRKKAEAVRRSRKLARKQAIRDGLVAALDALQASPRPRRSSGLMAIAEALARAGVQVATKRVLSQHRRQLDKYRTK
jgi:small subunit ribosomal protein S21